MAGTGRVLIAELDSLAQAERFAAAAHPGEAITELSGALRLGVLVSSTVMITDVMLFDGAYFVALGPDGVLAELGASRASFPLTITGTHESLAHALAAREAAGPSFSWSLPQIGDDAVIPDAVRRAWQPWLDLAERGLLRYERQSGGAPLRLGAPPRLQSVDAVTIAATGLAAMLGRSAAIDRIDELHLGEADRAALFAWWNDGYLRMIAENAGADWLSFSPAGAAGVSAAHGDVPLPLSAALSAWARDARPASVALALDASRAQRRALREKPTWPRMRDLAYAITAVSSAPSRRGVISGSLVRLALALCVVALAIPGLGIGSLDNPWTWLAFVGVIATTVPWDALFALLGLLRRDPRATLMLHRGTR